MIRLSPPEQFDRILLTVELRGIASSHIRSWIGMHFLEWGIKLLGCHIRLTEILPFGLCPNCGADISGVLLEHPWFTAIEGGVTAGTPNEPGKNWVKGMQVCPECGHEWEVDG